MKGKKDMKAKDAKDMKAKDAKDEKAAKSGNLILPIQPVSGVRSADLTAIVTLAVTTVAASRLQALQIFATGEPGEEGKALVRMTVLFQGPIKAEPKLAELVRLVLERTARSGKFEGDYAFAVSAKARRPILEPTGTGPLGFADRIWDRCCQLAA